MDRCASSNKRHFARSPLKVFPSKKPNLRLTFIACKLSLLATAKMSLV